MITSISHRDTVKQTDYIHVVNMYSTAKCYYLIMRCPKCGMRFAHPADNPTVTCARVGCGNCDRLSAIGARFDGTTLEPSCRTVVGSSNFLNRWGKIKWTPQG
jgi:hypothetical protein